MYAFLRAPQSPADFSGMAPVWRKIDACVQETWRSKNKKSGENIILCCFSLNRDSKTHSQREAEVLLVTSIPCPLPWNAFGAPSIQGMGLPGSMCSSEGLWGGEWQRDMAQVMAVSYCTAGLFLELGEQQLRCSVGFSPHLLPSYWSWKWAPCKFCVPKKCGKCDHFAVGKLSLNHYSLA